MNITINPRGRKQWSITDTEIIYGKKEIPFSTICGIDHRPPIKFPGAQGAIFIHQEGKLSEKYGVDDSIALIYDKKDIENAKVAVEHLLKLFDNENYEIKVDEKTGNTYTTKKKEYVKPKQFYKKCNTCGHIYCYTQADLNKNKQLSRQAAANTFASAFGPAIMSATYNQTANDNSSRIINYDKCPKCNSADVISITEEEVENLSKTQNTQQATLSQADELKKFKDLLDSGIITQEEFDQKKKQLLGL